MPHPRRRIWFLAQTILAAVIVGAIGWHFIRILDHAELSWARLSLRPAWLLAAAFCYLAAHTVWGTFFWQLVRRTHPTARWTETLHAYFVSQVGKYVPGKAWVILIRVLLLRPRGLPATTVGVCGTFETLVSMASGAMLGVGLLAWSGWGLEVGSTGWIGFVLVAILPLSLALLFGHSQLIQTRFLKRLSRSGGEMSVPPVRLLVRGVIQASAGWALMTLSLLLIMGALRPDDATLTQLDPRGVMAAVALSYVAGFAALILPGGLGARELLLQQMLAVQLAAVGVDSAIAEAALIAVVVRLVWTIAEVILAIALLTVGVAPKHEVPLRHAVEVAS